MNVIGSTYEASEHCLECTEKRFPGLVNEEGDWESYLDGEGNPPHVFFDDTEWHRDAYCGTCGTHIEDAKVYRCNACGRGQDECEGSTPDC